MCPPLSASLHEIIPIWASVIEKAPASITKHHFPNILHFGDISKIDGGKIPPVHIITFGSPCQNLSNIGKRKGLAGSQSRLFYHAIGFIEEMRCATNGTYPVIAVWENVMGAFSSNNQLDFKAVLESFTETAIPMPASGEWANAGMVRGKDVDVCWRLLDARYLGIPSLKEEDVSFSWQISEEHVPQKYYLKPAICDRFLRLAERADCPPPLPVEYLLKKQGGKYPSSVPFKKDVCKAPQKTKIKQNSLEVLDESPSCSLSCNGKREGHTVRDPETRTQTERRTILYPK